MSILRRMRRQCIRTCFHHQQNTMSDSPSSNTQQFPLLSHPPISTSNLTHLYNPDNETTQYILTHEFLPKCPHKYMRNVAGDGNCFIRAFTYGLVRYYLLRNSSNTTADPLAPLLTQLADIRDQIEHSEGGDISHIDFFYETFAESLQEIHSEDELLALMNDKNATDAIIWWQRMICAWYLKENAEQYEVFAQGEGFADIASYCERNVLPVGVEMDNLSIMGLCSAFNVCVEIWYLDSKQSYKVRLPDADDLPVVAHLLFRPGHYDILCEGVMGEEEGTQGDSRQTQQ